jgi:3-phosphoshikimate 1-carboxyvinyltransferase
LKALESAGARLKSGLDNVEVTKKDLRAFEFDATHSPDLFPPLVTLASYCNGVTRIKGVSRLIYKESDRAKTLQQEFGKMGIDINIEDDVMLINGGRPVGAHVESHGDHRVAMAASIASLGASGTIYLRDSHAVAKSYPEFFRDMASVGAAVHE